jgi:hypothetical protein
MVSLAKKLEKEKVKNRILLTTTKKIHKNDIKADPIWDFVNNEYKENQDSSWMTKATVTLINSMFYQRRLVFALTRTDLRALLQNDENWKKGIGLKDSYYSEFLKHIIRSGLVEAVELSKTGRKVMVLKVIHPELLDKMQVDVAQQIQQTIDFANYEGEFKPDKNKKNSSDEHIFEDTLLMIKIGKNLEKNKPQELANINKLEDINKINAKKRNLYLEEYRNNRSVYGE